MTQSLLLIGGAGTGKTTTLLRTMDKVLETGVTDVYGIGFVSFTRAARREAASRAAEKFGVGLDDLEQNGWFKTLHSVCHRQLSASSQLIADSKKDREWLSNLLGEEVNSTTSAGEDGVFETSAERTDPEVALSLWHHCRNRLTTLKPVWERASFCDQRTPSLDYCLSVIKKYETGKRLDHRMDFTDMLAEYSGWKFSPGGDPSPGTPRGEVPDVPVWFLDEAQDQSALSDAVARRMTSTAKWVYLVGDPYQCQPAGTMVRTTKGDKRIEDLDPETDRLVSYDRQSGSVVGFTAGYRFIKASRPSTPVYSIKAGDRSSRGTSNHQWLVKWCNKAKEKTAVYLMRKGDRWRVGWCQVFTCGKENEGNFHLGTRCNGERADEAWILTVTDDRTEASIIESYVSAEYGIPTATFRALRDSQRYTEESLEKLFSMFNPHTQRSRAEKLLADYGRDIRFPIWEGDLTKRGMARIQKVETCNIIPGIMSVPHHIDKKQIKWVVIDSVKFIENEPVWSLDVEKHHNYVSDGIVTCNSIFGFTGADPQLFQNWTDNRKILDQSFRCPKAFTDLGESIIRNCSNYWDRGIRPASHDGSVETIDYRHPWPEQVKPYERWLLLCRSNFIARRLAKRLDASGIPWASVKGNSSWTAPKRNKAIIAMRDMQNNNWVSVEEWKLLMDYLPVKVDGKEILTHGTKAHWQRYDGGFEEGIHCDEISAWGGTDEFLRILRSSRWTSLIPNAPDVLAAMKKWGDECVLEPKVQISTIHGAKGSEADNVLLLTTTSSQVARSSEEQVGRDEELRLGYVAVTRARKRLIIASEPVQHRMEVGL